MNGNKKPSLGQSNKFKFEVCTDSLSLMLSRISMSNDKTCTVKTKQTNKRSKFSVNKVDFIIYLLRLNVKHTLQNKS